MSLFKRLFGPDEPEEAPDGEVAIEPAQDQSLSPHDPGRTRRARIVIALSDAPRRREGGRRRSWLPQGTECSRQPTPGSVRLQGNLARAHEEIPRPKRPSTRSSLKPEDRQP